MAKSPRAKPISSFTFSSRKHKEKTTTLARRIMEMNTKCVALERLVREIASAHALPPDVVKRIDSALAELHSTACADAGQGVTAA